MNNEERILARIDELTEFIHSFPESRLVPVFQRAIEELESKL